MESIVQNTMQNGVQNTTQNNVITLVGRVCQEITLSHEILGENFYEFLLEVSRLSDVSDFLPITISERLFDLDQLTMGKRVNIIGQLRSYNNHQFESNNRLKLTTFVKSLKIIDDNVQDSNTITINGFLCKNPLYRCTSTKKEIADIIVAVNRSYKKSDYIPAILWNKNAHDSANLKIGDNLKLIGRLQSRNYIKKIDEEYAVEKTAYEVSVSRIEVLGNNSVEHLPKHSSNISLEDKGEKV